MVARATRAAIDEVTERTKELPSGTHITIGMQRGNSEIWPIANLKVIGSFVKRLI